MYNYNKHLKLKKQRNFTQIQDTYNYIYFCRLNDLPTQQLTTFKKELKKFDVKIQSIKVKLVIKKISTLKSQNSTIILFFNKFEQLISLDNFLKFQSFFQPLFLVHGGKAISKYKFTKLSKNSTPLPSQLKKSVFGFYITLLEINSKYMADIT